LQPRGRRARKFPTPKPGLFLDEGPSALSVDACSGPCVLERGKISPGLNAGDSRLRPSRRRVTTSWLYWLAGRGVSPPGDASTYLGGQGEFNFATGFTLRRIRERPDFLSWPNLLDAPVSIRERPTPTRSKNHA
jgi:hypothetical protein